MLVIYPEAALQVYHVAADRQDQDCGELESVCIQAHMLHRERQTSCSAPFKATAAFAMPSNKPYGSSEYNNEHAVCNRHFSC